MIDTLNPRPIVEIYTQGAIKPFMRIESSMVPMKGEFISIGGKTFKVMHRTFAIDYSAETFKRQMRCNLEVKEVK